MKGMRVEDGRVERAKSAASPILTLDAVIGREFFFHEFWKSSTSHVALKRKGQLNEENRKIEEKLHTKKAHLDETGKYQRVYSIKRRYYIDRTLGTLWLVKNPCFIRV